MTKHQIFSMIYNFYDYCSGKNIKTFEQETFYFNRRTTKRLMHVVEKIYGMMESKHFTGKDFMFYLFITCLQKGKEGCFNINPNKIKKTIKSFSVEQTKADHERINQIMEETNTKLDDFIKVKEDGKSLLYELFTQNFITVCLIIKYSKKFLTSAEQNSILNDDYKTFINLLKLTLNFIKGEQNGKKI